MLNFGTKASHQGQPQANSIQAAPLGMETSGCQIYPMHGVPPASLEGFMRNLL